jgi:hypothetical protein
MNRIPRRLLAAAGALAGLVVAATAFLSCSSAPRGPAGPPEVVSAVAHEFRADVTALAVDIGPRALGRNGDSLERAATWVEDELRKTGIEVHRHVFNVDAYEAVNLVAELKGTGSRADEIVILGAHYDTAGPTPGANDNGSGVAALLALARRSAAMKPDRTLRFVAFANEEPPYFQTALMGSRVYAKACRENGDDIVAMISLETMGYFNDARGSQHYPPVIGWFYPSTGNFIGFVSDRGSRRLLKRISRAFRLACDFPCEAAALPASLPGVGWSDHWSFWQEGYPAVMVTDTALFRYPHYHEVTDTPDKLDYERLARVVLGLEIVVRELATEARASAP